MRVFLTRFTWFCFVLWFFVYSVSSVGAPCPVRQEAFFVFGDGLKSFLDLSRIRGACVFESFYTSLSQSFRFYIFRVLVWCARSCTTRNVLFL